MIDEEFTLYEVLDADDMPEPKRSLLDRIPLPIRCFLRRHFSWPPLTKHERWETLVLINEEFHKQLEVHLLATERREAIDKLDKIRAELPFEYLSGSEEWN
jgi:hypothetical protein